LAPELGSRVTKVTYPANGGALRTATNGYSPSGTYDARGFPLGDPLTTWSKDDAVTGSTTAGKITTVSNLLGQTVSYSDVWGTVTTIIYDQVGRVTSTTTTLTSSPSTQTESTITTSTAKSTPSVTPSGPHRPM
jgi:YD repeat-containing protein